MVAYADANKNHVQDAGDVMIAEIVDTNGSGSVDPGDTINMIGGLAGRRYEEQPAASADLWDPVTDSWTTIKYPKAGTDQGHTAMTLTHGTVVVIGGRQEHGKDRIINSIEAWAP